MSESRVVIVDTSRVLDDFFKVDAATLRYRRFNGTLSEPVRRLVVERGNSAAVILYDRDSREIILVEQFKWPTYAADGGWIVETLAGAVDGDEDPAESAVRETLEETGYAVGDPEFICRFYASPGGSSEQIFLFYAEVDDEARIRTGGGVVEEGEDIVLRRYTLPDAMEAIQSGLIVDAKAIIGINWVRQRTAQSE